MRVRRESCLAACGNQVNTQVLAPVGLCSMDEVFE